MTDPFRRVAESILARMGRDALLRGIVLCKVPLEHGVEIVGEYGQVVALRTVATIDKALLPYPKDTLAIDGVNYTLDGLIADNGYTVRYTLLAA